MASANPAWVLVEPEGKSIIDNLCTAVEYGKNLKFTLAEVEKVTAAYFSSYPALTAIAFALFIKFLIATFPLLNSQSPTDQEPSMTITLSISWVTACLLRRVFVGFINKKLVINVFAVSSMEGTVWNSAKENKTKNQENLTLELAFKNLKKPLYYQNNFVLNLKRLRGNAGELLAHQTFDGILDSSLLLTDHLLQNYRWGPFHSFWHCSKGLCGGEGS